MAIYGNATSFRLLAESVTGAGPRTVLLSGPAHSGKLHAATEAVGCLHPDDVLFPDSGIDGAREASAFARSSPMASPVRAIVVADADRLSEPAQDAYLKLCEEPPRSLVVVLTSSNPSLIAPALLSRVRSVVRWSACSADEIRAYADSVGTVDDWALSMCGGLPGMYALMAHQPRLREAAASIRALAAGEQSILSDVPSAVAKMDSKSQDRDAIIWLLRFAARDARSHACGRALLKLARTYAGQPSANAELHWLRAVAELSAV